MMASFLEDVRLAWRGLLRSPGFAAVAIATLALGIGAAVAAYLPADRTSRIEPLVALSREVAQGLKTLGP